MSALRLALLLFLSFLLLPGAAYAQGAGKDSLRAIIRAHAHDTAGIEAYYQYGLLLEGENLDSAGVYYRKARALAQATHHIRGQIHYASYYSDILNQRGQWAASYTVNREALRLAQAAHLPLEIAKAYTNVGNVFNYQSQYDSAIVYYQQAIARFERLGERRYMQVLYQNLGIVFDELKQYQQAIAYAEKATAISRQRGDSLTLASVLLNKAGSLASLKQYGAALAAAREGLTISRRLKNGYNEQIANITLGNIYTHQRRYGPAADAFGEALRLGRQLQADTSVALSGLAMAAFEAGDYRRADAYATVGLKASELSGAPTERVRTYKLVADIKAHLGQHPAAYAWLLKATALNDSLTSAEVTTRVQELEKKYESARKDRALLNQRLQLAVSAANARRRQLWLALVGGLAVLLAGALVVAQRAYRQRQREAQQRILALEREAEVIQLKATLAGQQAERQRIAKEMHDEIGSGLTTILYLSNAGGGTDAAKGSQIGTTARQLVSQMNDLVWSMSAGQDSLEELVTYIRHNISELLTAVDVDYDFHIPDTVPAVAIGGQQRRNLYLAVKEAVHNSIKHAGASLVTLAMDFADGITIRVSDDGRGLPPDGGRRFGNGLKNMRHRLESIGGSFRLVQEQPVAVEFHLPADRIV